MFGMLKDLYWSSPQTTFVVNPLTVVLAESLRGRGAAAGQALRAASGVGLPAVQALRRGPEVARGEWSVFPTSW